MTPADRRRLAVATVITLVALPALWLMQRDDTAPGRNTVAAVGAPAAPVEGDQDTTAPTDPAAPAYLEGPDATEAPAAAAPAVATGTDPDLDDVTGTASFLRFDPARYPAGSCQVPAAPLWHQVTVRNVDNDRTITCLNVSTVPPDDQGVAVIDTALFLQIADLVDAPLPVALSW